MSFRRPLPLVGICNPDPSLAMRWRTHPSQMRGSRSHDDGGIANPDQRQTHHL